MPIWKTSYQLVLADDAKPMLQGWAIVENTTEEDWSGVHLTLVSGRPVSFIMNLYDPLYVQRPTVEPELFAGLRPQLYGQALDERDATERAENLPALALHALEHEAKKGDGRSAGKPAAPMAAPMGGMGGHFAQRSLALIEAEAASDNYGYAGVGVASVAQSGDVGELFQYAIIPPVTLARQESAMLPIVDEHVDGKKLSVYNPAVQGKHPLCGLRLKNTTELHLMQGPITVFDGGTYAGDARIEDIAPGGERLLTYALDLDVECTSQMTSVPEEITSISLVKGVLRSERKQVRTRKYKIKNSSQKAKTVLIEQPLDADWHLVAPKEPTEKTRELYRFALDAEPGKTAELEVVEEHLIRQQIEIANTDDSTIRFFVGQRVTSPQVKTALERLIEMKAGLAQVVDQRTGLEQQLKTITQEQDRIRQNMMQLDRNSDLYKRYVKKFGDQEDAVERLRGQVERLSQDETQRRKALDDYLLSLDLK